MRRLLLGLVILVLLVVGVVGGILAWMIAGNAPLEDGRTFADGRVTTVVDGYVSCFLVQTANGFLLIDACMDAATIQAVLHAKGATAADVHSIFLTHGHEDHVGGVGAFTAATVYALQPELNRLEGREPHLGPFPALRGAVDTGIRAKPLTDGAIVDADGSAIEVLAVPGHTVGSAAYLLDGLVFLGDNASVKHDELVGATWIFSDDTTENLAAMKALVPRLDGRGVTWWIPAHTGPTADASHLR